MKGSVIHCLAAQDATAFHALLRRAFGCVIEDPSHYGRLNSSTGMAQRVTTPCDGCRSKTLAVSEHGGAVPGRIFHAPTFAQLCRVD